MPVLKHRFPNAGCQSAFDCGKDFMLKTGGDPDLLRIALTFCETPQEEHYFQLGMVEEAADLIEVTYV